MRSIIVIFHASDSLLFHLALIFSGSDCILKHSSVSLVACFLRKFRKVLVNAWLDSWQPDKTDSGDLFRDDRMEHKRKNPLLETTKSPEHTPELHTSTSLGNRWHPKKEGRREQERGTLGYVHISCLEKWLNSSSRISCELCHYRYDIQQTRRYTLLESLRLWLRHPVNWRHLQADIIILILLSIITTVLIIICTLSMDYFVIEGRKYGVTDSWTKGVLDIFLTLVVSGYIGTMAFLVKQQLTPWYHWWTNTLNIQLRMNWNLACLETRKKLFDELVPHPLDSGENLVSDDPDVCPRGNSANNGEHP